jgi:glutamate formiminotransferase
MMNLVEFSDVSKSRIIHTKKREAERVLIVPRIYSKVIGGTP